MDGAIVDDPPPMGHLLNEVQAPSRLLIEGGPRDLRPESGPRVDDFDPDGPALEAHRDADPLAGRQVGVADAVRDQLAHQESDVVEDRRRHAVLELVQRPPRGSRRLPGRLELELDRGGHRTSPTPSARSDSGWSTNCSRWSN